MAFDSNLTLQSTTTQTATFQSAGVSLRQPSSTSLTNAGGTPRRGLAARVRYNTATTSSGTATVTWTIQHADDNATWNTISQQLDAPVTFSGAPGASGFVVIPFSTDKPWVRLVTTIAGGTAASIVFASEVSTAWERPA